MNINLCVISDDTQNNLIKVREEFINYLEDNKASEYKFKVYNKVTGKVNIDFLVLFFDNIDDVKKYTSKSESIRNILIITSNVSSKFILECIKITQYIIHSSFKPQYILDKIITIKRSDLDEKS